MYKVIKYVNDSGLSAEFVLEHKIGEGAYGEVYICPVQNWDPGLKVPKVVACKKVKLRYEDEFEEIKDREIKICAVSEGKHLCMFKNIETKNPLQIKQYIYIMFVPKYKINVKFKKCPAL